MTSATLDLPTISTLPISEADAQRAASAYVTAHIDPMFEVVEGTRYYHKGRGREIWQFIIRCAYGALDAILVDAKTGEVLRLEPQQLRIIRERAMIAEARTRGRLPVDEQGYILAEYARRKANGYLTMAVSLSCEATDGILIPLAPPIWQFAIRFGLPRLGELGMLGTLDVDAQTGQPLPLTPTQIKRMRVRADALVQFHTPPPAA